MAKIRLDQLLVQRGLADSREQAQRLIRAGMVRVDNQPAGKPGHQYPDDIDLFVKEQERYVSRGGLKIEAAYRAFGFPLDGAVCLDIGSSTGGPPAIERILTALPADFPAPIVIAQHMQRIFTEGLARRLDGQCAIAVRHAEAGMALEPATAYMMF